MSVRLATLIQANLCLAAVADLRCALHLGACLARDVIDIYRNAGRSMQRRATDRWRNRATAHRNAVARLNEAQALALIGSWEWSAGTGEHTWSDELHCICGHEAVGFTPSQGAILALLHPADRQAALDAFERMLQSRGPSAVNLRLVRADGCERTIHCCGIASVDANGVLQRVTGTAQDATERELAEERIRFLANHDRLTQLPNRMLLTDRLEQALAWGQRHGHSVALLFVDLDNFKQINDTLGHASGDEILKTAAGRLRKCVRETDTVARLGGDEFVLLVPEGEDGYGFQVVARRILESFAKPISCESREFSLTCSIGVSVYPQDGEDPETLIRAADTAMYLAKEEGRNNCHRFAAPGSSPPSRSVSLEAALRQALDRDEFSLHYVPQIDLETGEVIGVEALLRWENPVMGKLSPAAFLALAEQTGQIVPLGEWVLQAACAQQKAWTDLGLAPIRIAVNVSARQFGHIHFPRQVAAVLQATEVSPEQLEIEPTEGILAKHPEAAIGTIKQLKGLDVRSSLDDFGTGYSSLSNLRRFAPDAVKIDRSFVREITSDPDSVDIANAVIAMAHSLKLQVVAEGVKTAGQLACLRRLRCDRMQGFYFSRPLPADRATRLLRERRKLRPLPGRADHDRDTLLLVDDEPDVLASLQRTLSQEGYCILTANSARTAFELLALDPVRVIVADHHMPETNGRAFLTRTRELYPDTYRIMLSGYTELQSVAEAINRGGIAKHLAKPWDDQELRDCVSEAFRAAKMVGEKPGEKAP